MPDTMDRKIVQLQSEYKTLLISAKESFDTELFTAILDEIYIFWSENIKIVDMFLRNLPRNCTTYFFTASTYLDVLEKEHYPFISIGEIHIFDDPLIRALINLQKTSSWIQSQDFIQEVKKIIDDNLLVNSDCAESILILPLQLVNSKSQGKQEDENPDNLFLGLFQNTKNLSSYFSDFSTIKDIESGLRRDIADAIVFNPNSENLPLSARFAKAREYYNFDFMTDKNDAECFYFIVRGYLEQSHSTISLALYYSIFPYLRDPVVLFYLILLLSNVEYQEQIELLKVRSVFANIFQDAFDRNITSAVSVEKYLEILRRTQFKLAMSEFIDGYKSISTGKEIIEITSFIQQKLDILYKSIRDASPPTPRPVDPTTPTPDV